MSVEARQMAAAATKLAAAFERIADFLDHIRAREEARDEKYEREEREEAAEQEARAAEER